MHGSTSEDKDARSDHFSARCRPDQKQRWMDLSLRLGYENFSEFLVLILDSLCDRYEVEGWESRLLHVSGDRIVGAGLRSEGVAAVAGAFPIVAPDHFWKAVEGAVKRRAS